MKNTPPLRRWVWEEVDPNRAGASGDYSKLFRNHRDPKPGFLAVGAPSIPARVMAREVIQNSWDAAIELRDEFRKQRNAPPPPPPPPPPPNSVDDGFPGIAGLPDFQIAFDFRSLVGGRKADLVRALRLDEHAERLSRVGAARNSLGLGAELCLDQLEESKPLSILVIEETAASGMHGPWKGSRSKLYRALSSLGIRSGETETGGSYGFGKAGLIGGSAPRIVVAYSCFRKRSDDPGVTRRLLGITYWDSHRLDGVDYLGIARWNDGAEPARPFENEAADAIATELGLRRRTAREPEDLGSTFLLVEPTVEPEDLETAVCRNWWPALEDPSLRFQVEIRRPDGTAIIPRPSQDPVLRSFVRAYRKATEPLSRQTGQSPNLQRKPIYGRDSQLAGELALVSDPNGWSFPGEESEDESLVALMRGPRMVVEYLRQSFRDPRPVVRGVFVADPRVNAALRVTEPYGHDAWEPEGEGREAERALAKKIKASIKAHVQKRRKALRPPPSPPPETVPLPEFDRIMRQILGGGGGGKIQSPPAPRPVSIEGLRFDPESAGGGRIQQRGSVRFGLSDRFPGVEAEIEVRIRFLLVEDGAAGSESVAVHSTPPDGFTPREDGWFVGSLARGEPLRFEFRTEPYEADWTGRFFAEANLRGGTRR